MDERLLARLDADPLVKRDGRSAVLRRAAEHYLAARRAKTVADEYRRAYAASDHLGAEWAGWENEGAWPEP
jgi:hypothetical protein